MMSTFATTRASATTIVQAGRDGDLLPGRARGRPRAGRARGTRAVAAVPMPMRTRFLRHVAHVAGKYACWSGTADVMQGRRFSGRREVAIGLGVYAVYLLASRRKRRRGRRGCRRRETPSGSSRSSGGSGSTSSRSSRSSCCPHRRLLGVLNVAYVVSNAALTVGWLMRLYAQAPSRVPPLPPCRRADDACLASPSSTLPLCAAALARPPRGHDRGRQRRRPRPRPRRAALRPARGDAEHPRRLRSRDGRRRRGGERRARCCARSRPPTRRSSRRSSSSPRTTTSSTRSPGPLSRALGLRLARVLG